MLRNAIVAIVYFCIRRAVLTVALAVLLAIVGGAYAVQHFSLDADANNLISHDLPWRKHEAEFEKLFPSKYETILAVLEAPTSELATQASSALVARLAERKELFHSVADLGGGPLFEQNGLLFLPTEEVVSTTKMLGEAKSIIQVLAQDPNVRGLTTALNYGLIGLRSKRYSLDDMSGLLNMAADTLDAVLASKSATFSW